MILSDEGPHGRIQFGWLPHHKLDHFFFFFDRYMPSPHTDEVSRKAFQIPGKCDHQKDRAEHEGANKREPALSEPRHLAVVGQQGPNLMQGICD